MSLEEKEEKYRGITVPASVIRERELALKQREADFMARRAAKKKASENSTPPSNNSFIQFIAGLKL